jgi:hypothetical protein
MLSLALPGCAKEGRAARNLPGEWVMRLIECRIPEPDEVTILAEIQGPEQIEARGLQPSGIGRAKIDVRSGVEGTALEWRFGPPKPEGWFESIRVTEGSRLGGSLVVSMSELFGPRPGPTDA